MKKIKRIKETVCLRFFWPQYFFHFCQIAHVPKGHSKELLLLLFGVAVIDIESGTDNLSSNSSLIHFLADAVGERHELKLQPPNVQNYKLQVQR